MDASTRERGPKAVPDPEGDQAAIDAMNNGAQPPGDEPDPDLEGQGAEEQPKIFDLQLEGDRKLNNNIGGRKPDKATVKLRGGSIIVPEGQYEKGDTLNLVIGVRCTEVHGVDKMDNSTGEIVETERRQVFKVTAVEKV